jgi:hypothetical protein
MDTTKIIDLYLWSGNGEKDATNGSGEVKFYNLRPQGYILDTEKYKGYIINLADFQSFSITQTALDNIAYANNEAGATVHFQIAEISQPNSITNINSNSGGVSSYSSNAKILRSMHWVQGGTIKGHATGEDNDYMLGSVSSDINVDGVYITYPPLENMTVRLINSSGNVINLSGAVNRKSDNVNIDCTWTAHIQIIPIIRD